MVLLSDFYLQYVTRNLFKNNKLLLGFWQHTRINFLNYAQFLFGIFSHTKLLFSMYFTVIGTDFFLHRYDYIQFHQCYG